MTMSNSRAPIAVFDSGVGGLSILKEIQRLLPTEDLIYFGDQANVPYGPRSPENIQKLTKEATGFLLEQDAKAIVIACNTASAFALHEMRSVHPDVPFIGMEPAVKPAAKNTKTGTIGVLMTEATSQGELYKSVVDRFANGHNVLSLICPQFVDLVEAGNLSGPEAQAAVHACLDEALAQGADQLVLGCTHFTFLSPLIQKMIGAGVTIVDPSPAVARQVQYVTDGQRNDQGGVVTLYSTAQTNQSLAVLSQLSGYPIEDIKRYPSISSMSSSS